AGLGVAQMRRMEDLPARRRRVAEWYAEDLAQVEELELPRAAGWAEPAWFVYFLRAKTGPDRDALVAHLNECGVESKAYFDPPIHEQPPHAGSHHELPATEDAARRTLIVPYF